jgi:MOSC domain-containing protein YiiM
VPAGRIIGIHVTPEKGADPRPLDEVRAEPGKGLEGDRRHAAAAGSGEATEPSREITLIEKEALDALARETDIRLTAADTRRNLLTEGVALNHLVEREFRVGELVLKGERLCEPCGYLEGRTAKGVVQGLLHRGGLRARIVRGGVVRVGDEVSPVE